MDDLAALLSPLCGEPKSRTVAQELMAAFGSVGAVLSAPEHRLTEHTELKVAAHLRQVHVVCRRMLREQVKDGSIIRSWKDLEQYLLFSLRHQTIEKFVILFLDTKNGLIAEEAFDHGTVNHVPLYPREIAKRCIQLDASRVIVVHNHPSGDPTPSGEDIIRTRELIAALSPLGIAVHEHAIVGRNNIVGLRFKRLL